EVHALSDAAEHAESDSRGREGKRPGEGQGGRQGCRAETGTGGGERVSQEGAGQGEDRREGRAQDDGRPIDLRTLNRIGEPRLAGSVRPNRGPDGGEKLSPDIGSQGKRGQIGVSGRPVMPHVRSAAPSPFPRHTAWSRNSALPWMRSERPMPIRTDRRIR